ncbi:MAG: TRAP transporter small permease [Gammaproteobacteria bacterium]|jgi:TRAP-type C4-dicarboxylate transport system permease small subunit|nr:TRAP transporter small permease [Gammaproteobacteria bacterium]
MNTEPSPPIAAELLDYLSRAFMVIGGIALGLLVLLATANVAARLLGLPFAGAYEVVAFLGALVTASALAYTQLRRDHIMVDIITCRYPPLIKRGVDALSDLLALSLFGILTWQVWMWGDKIRLAGERSETLQLSFHPFIYGVAVGFGLLTLVLALQMVQALVGGERQKAPAGGTDS